MDTHVSNPLVSVLVTVYNAEQFLRQCLDSIVNQTYRNLQVVLIDDGSIDDSRKICEEYGQQYGFVEVYSQPNRGVANTRNALLKKVRGNYFIFVDSDDWIETSMIEDMLEASKSHHLDIMVCGFYKESDLSNSERPEANCGELKVYDKHTAIYKFLRHKDLNGSLWNKLIRTECAIDHKFDNSVSYGEDALFLWGCLQNIKTLGIFDRPYYHYRMNDDSLSHQSLNEKRLSGRKVWQRLSSEAKEYYSEFASMTIGNYAVSDFWLLIKASCSNYPENEIIIECRKNISKNIFRILRHNLLSLNKWPVLLAYIINYGIASKLVRRILR